VGTGVRRRVPEIYVRREFEYRFVSEEERREERSKTRRAALRQFLASFIVIGPIALGIGWARYYFDALGLAIFAGPLGVLLGAGTVYLVAFFSADRSGIALVLERQWLAVFRFRNKPKWPPAPRFNSRHIRLMRWVPEGCRIMGQAFGGGVLIDRRLLAQPDAVDTLEDWCEQHGIPMEGIRPLPDGRNPYDKVRPLDEQRIVR
jgi:hypothetical protein